MKKTSKKHLEEYLYEWVKTDENGNESNVETMVIFTYEYEKGYESLNYYEPHEPAWVEVSIHKTEGEELDADEYENARMEIESILLEELYALAA
jgi:hypothetical protein